ncbi:ead/Ea22-like family protein, partial [Escherichia coli]
MSKIDYQALREAAEAIKIAATPQKLLAFRMKVTPQVVLELLDEREAQSKRIAELEANFATLAVENVGLNKFIKDDCFIYTSDDISPRDANGFKPETPATDAFLA